MTTPPYQSGPYGQPNQDPYGQGGYGQQGPPGSPQYGPPQYGGRQGGGNDQTQWLGGAPRSPWTQQNPYGTPYGAGPQQWPGGGGAHLPPPPRKRTGMVVAIVAIAVVVLAGAGVGLYFVNKDDGNGTAGGDTTTTGPPAGTATAEPTAGEPGDAIDARPGDCIKVNIASSTNADVETVDCATPEAMYRVATREETDTASCPNDQYVSYTEEGQLLLCLQLNVAEGECLQVTDNEDKRADCAASEATHKVLGVLDGVDDETKCSGAATEVVTYPKPPLTICLGSPTA